MVEQFAKGDHGDIGEIPAEAPGGEMRIDPLEIVEGVGVFGEDVRVFAQNELGY